MSDRRSIALSLANIGREYPSKLDPAFLPGGSAIGSPRTVNCLPFGDINWIDPTAAAVGEMIYNLCKALGVEVSKEIADCIYTALLTDTGSFHFSNTTERTLKIASELVRCGVEPARTSELEASAEFMTLRSFVAIGPALR